MKLKRRLLTLFLVMTMVMGFATVSRAASKTIWSSTGTLSMYGYIDMVKGPLWITDKVYYVASIQGDDSSRISKYAHDVYVEPGTNKKTLTALHLYTNRKMVSGNNVSCGYGGSEGRLKMKCDDSEYTIVQPR